MSRILLNCDSKTFQLQAKKFLYATQNFPIKNLKYILSLHLTQNDRNTICELMFLNLSKEILLNMIIILFDVIFITA